MKKSDVLIALLYAGANFELAEMKCTSQVEQDATKIVISFWLACVVEEVMKLKLSVCLSAAPAGSLPGSEGSPAKTKTSR
jgi:hypothetical protein